MLIKLFSLLIFTTIFCPQSNSQSFQQFTSARQLSIQQQQPLRTLYSSLSSLPQNYLFQIQPNYLFHTSNIQDCTIIPQNINFNSYDDIWICLTKKILILKCNIQWELKIGCGTYLELHKPFNSTVLSKRKINDMENVLHPINMPVIHICAGTYHIWLVYSTRIGKVVKNIKPVFITNPTC